MIQASSLNGLTILKEGAFSNAYRDGWTDVSKLLIGRQGQFFHLSVFPPLVGDVARSETVHNNEY